MSSVESIARIGGKGLSLDHIPGGIPVTSMEELMGSLAGLERGSLVTGSQAATTQNARC